MTRRLVQCVVVGAAAAAAQQAMSGRQGMFRSRAEVVTANVSVRSGGKAVPGLGAADFEVLDNGVHQAVTDIAYESVPIDVTLLLDGSASTSSLLDRFASDTHQIAALLRPEDRIRLP